MPGEFDITGARAAGYSDEEIAEYLRSKKLTPRATLPGSVASMSPADAEAAFQSAKNDSLGLRYEPAGPESGRFKLRVPRRNAPAEHEQYRGITGLLREYSPGAADLIEGMGWAVGKVLDDPGLKYLPGPEAVAIPHWRPGMRLAEIPAGLKDLIPRAGARLEVEDAQRYLQDRVRKALGAIPENAPDHVKLRRLLNLGRKEFADQLTQPYSGVEWYGSDTAMADRLLRPVYPELQDPVKNTIQKAMSAAMSNNSNPRAEAFNGARIWKPYRETGRFPLFQPSGKHWPAQGIDHQIVKLNRMLGELKEEGLADFLTSPEVSGRDIKYFVPNAKEVRLKDLYPGGNVLGPKLGPYFRDLMGIPQADTVVDVWMMRQKGRRLGGLFDAGGNAIAAPRTEGERRLQMEVDRRLAGEHGIAPRDGQSVGWHYEQDLYRKLGLPTKSYKRSDGIREFLESLSK